MCLCGRESVLLGVHVREREAGKVGEGVRGGGVARERARKTQRERDREVCAEGGESGDRETERWERETERGGGRNSTR